MKKLIFFLILIGVTIYYFGNYYKPQPKIRQVIFNVPDLINKDIDQLMKVFGKTPSNYTDSISTITTLSKKDENSRYDLWGITDRTATASFTYYKDGWCLSTNFNYKTKEIENMYLSVESDKFRRIGFDNIDDLLIIGNLDMKDKKYRLVFTDWLKQNFEISSIKKDETYYEVEIFPINNN